MKRKHKFFNDHDHRLYLQRLYLLIGFYLCLTCVQSVVFSAATWSWPLACVLTSVLGLIAHLGLSLYLRAEFHRPWLESRGQNRDLLFRFLLPLCGYPLGFYYLAKLGFTSWFVQVAILNLLLFAGQVLLYVLDEEVILYVVFGGLTTFVSLGSFIVLSAILPGPGESDENWFVRKLLSFSLAILFAFWSNRRFVFQSHGPVCSEFIAFISSRLLTSAIFELGGLWLCIHVFQWTVSLSNLLVVMTVVVVNYFLSKYLVFHKEKEKKDARFF